MLRAPIPCCARMTEDPNREPKAELPWRTRLTANIVDISAYLLALPMTFAGYFSLMAIGSLDPSGDLARHLLFSMGVFAVFLVLLLVVLSARWYAKYQRALPFRGRVEARALWPGCFASDVLETVLLVASGHSLFALVAGGLAFRAAYQGWLEVFKWATPWAALGVAGEVARRMVIKKKASPD